MARKTSRIAPYNSQNANSYVVAESFKDSQGEELGAGVIIRNNTLQSFGNETKASLSRLYPDGMDSTGPSRAETSEYFHIYNSVNPFNSDSCGVSAKETIDLCQKAFYNFPSFRNPIIMQSYLANSPLHFTGKNEKIVDFYKNWAKKCNLWDFANQFFLEWWRSGNLFVYKFEGELKLSDIKKLSKANEAIARNRKIPLKYALFNPYDIRGLGSSSFSGQSYGKILNAYEVQRLLNQETESDKAIYNSLDEEAKRQIQLGQNPTVKLDNSRLIAIFNAKQAYEPMAVPPYFGVLRSINFKQILRSAEEKVAASADYCILFVTAGDEKKKEGENRKLLEAMANLFSAQSVGRVLFAHYSAKAEFIIPDLNKIFGNAKYENVDQDIINGMNDIMASDESFATGQTKTKIYLQLLSQARESFLNFFLIPEMEKIAEEMGFSEVPKVNFEEVTLESLNEGKKLYNRLYELGALTPDELFHAYNTNQLPRVDSSIESQKAFKAQKKSGIYEPLIGNNGDDAGRPTGTKAPKTSKKVSPKGQASLERLKEIYPKMSSVAEKVQTLYKEKNSISRLSQKHKNLTDSIWEKVIASSPPDKWEECAAAFVSNPLTFNAESEQYQQIEELAEEHQMSILSAAILFHSFENI